MTYVIAVSAPILLGFMILCGAVKQPRPIKIFTAASVVLTSLLTWVAILAPEAAPTEVLSFTDKLVVAFRADGLTKLFAGMVSILWIPTTFYAFEYMKHEGGEQKFFGFFVMAFGVVNGIAFSANLFTLYLFYEYLTFATLPLVMHAMDDKARYAAKKYLIYMIFGGALAFVGLLFLMQYGVTLDFTYGGILDVALVAGHEDLLRWAFVVTFLGFGVKAAVFPLNGWLPSASVAPTPVTALLHAVAVVKSGVFAIARAVYFCFGASLLSGSFAQQIMMIMAIFTIVYGSVMALRTPHLKRRLAYSTISNLSYILFGLSLMTPAGLEGAMLHMLLHGLIKITLFFVAGAILYKTHLEYAADMYGLARKMPITWLCFAASGLGLIGIPPFAAFHSKYLMATAAISLQAALPFVGVVALVISEMLTAIYLFKPIIGAYFAAPPLSMEGFRDPNGMMLVPIAALTIASLAAALLAGNLIQLLNTLLL